MSFMDTRRFIPLVVLGTGLILAYAAQWCGLHPTCGLYLQLNSYLSSVLRPTIFFTLYGLVGAVSCIFIRKDLQTAWFRFFLLWIPFSVFYIANTQVAVHSLFAIFMFIRNDAARLTAIIFSAVSLGFLVYDYCLCSKSPRSIK